MGLAIILQIALQEMITASLDWFPFGAPPIYRSLGVVQRVTSGREGVLVALVEALTHLGRQREDQE